MAAATDMEMVRKIILEQEALFREQVQELHRVYRLQKLLVHEARQQQQQQQQQQRRLLQFGGSPIVKTEPVHVGSPSPSPAPAPTPPKRRMFDLELPAEEYMDVEMEAEEPSRNGVNTINLVSKMMSSNGGSDRGRDGGESEILQMLKRAKSGGSDEQQQLQQQQQGFLNPFWRYGLDNEKGRGPNGFHIGPRADDKGSKQQQQQQLEQNNHMIFLDSNQRLHSAGIENFNPFFASADRSLISDGAFGGRLQNQLSYSGQGILIPSSSANLGRRDSFLDPAGLNLWLKSNSFYQQQQQQQQHHQHPQQQQQQFQILQSGSPVQHAWPHSSGFGSGTGSFHQHAPILASVPAVLPSSAAAAAAAAAASVGFSKEENGWLKPSTTASPAFHYSASTPPRPPFKKPPKLILDGATMEIKLAPADERGIPVLGLPRMHPDEEGEARSTEKGAEIPKPEQHQQIQQLGFTDLNAPVTCPISDKPPPACEEQLEDAGAARDEAEESAVPPAVESCQSRVEEHRSDDCNCLQMGCSGCDKGSSEKGVAEAGSEMKTESPVEPSSGSSSGRKRRLKLLSSSLATRESDKASGKKVDDDNINNHNNNSNNNGEMITSDGPSSNPIKRRKMHSSSSSKANSNMNNNINSMNNKCRSQQQQQSELRASPVRRHNKDNNGYAENQDDGANLAAEILVSLAPAKLPDKTNGVRLHHKSKRRLIDTLSTPPAVSPSPRSAAEPVKESESTKKKKKKKNKNGKSMVAKFQHEDNQQQQQPKVSVKSVKVALTQCEYPEIATEMVAGQPKSSSKHRKKQQQQQMVSKKQQQPAPISKLMTKSSSSGGARDGSKSTMTTTTTTTLNVVISKSNHHRQHHHLDKKSFNNSSNNNLSEQESLDRLSQQQQHSGENSSEVMGKESEEIEDSSWSRRSWGASARRKRMRRCKRSGL